VVFYGDSITDGWKLGEYFPGKPYVNRGISGQTTSQMLARLYADVIDLKPAALIILAGTNDIARNTGPVTLKMIGDNLRAMTELAQLHGIKVIFCGAQRVVEGVCGEGECRVRRLSRGARRRARLAEGRILW
jgi:lysophospholipase L1-like esterase